MADMMVGLAKLTQPARLDNKGRLDGAHSASYEAHLMADSVYVFGAGINRAVKDWDGFSPPLATDFFQQALKHKKFDDSYFRQKLSDVFNYISAYWKLSEEELRQVPFDLEACFTLLELQSEEVRAAADRERTIALAKIQYRLTAFLAEYLNEFEIFASSSDSFRKLGQILYEEKPAIISFNYDTLVEGVIELASGHHSGIPPWAGDPFREVSDEELGYNNHVWNRRLAYGIKFEEVELVFPIRPSHLSGNRYYALHNQFYD